jgi:hypothetical protein
MAALGLAARVFLPDGDTTAAMGLRLGVLVAVGMAGYAAIIFGVHGERVRAFRAFLRSVRE